MSIYCIIFENMKPTFKEKQKTLFKRQSCLRLMPTQSELLFKQRLEKRNIKFIFQKCFINKDYYCIVDFYLPKPNKIAIEIDGKYHNTHTQIYKDNYKDKYLTEIRDFKVIRIKNEDVLTFDLSVFK